MLNNREYIYSDPESEASRGSSLIPFINYGKPAPERCLDMLLAKYRGDNYQSEVLMNTPEITSAPQMKKPLNQAAIMLVTDGGLVPAGNPGRIPCANAGCFGVYKLKGEKGLKKQDYEVSHQGYENRYVEENPNRLLPVDVMREMERTKVIGRLYDSFLTTAGVMMSAEESMKMAERIADYIYNLKVDAVMIVSACGTSTRCGAYIGLAIEKIGIPVVQVSNLSQIAQSTGMKRVVKGNSISCPFGDPQLSSSEEYEQRKKLLLEALNKFEEKSV